MNNRNTRPRGLILSVFLLCTLGFSLELMAQEAGQLPPVTTPQSQIKPADDPGPVLSQPISTPQPPKDDRIFFALPNLLTVENASSLPPLTARQKFKTVAEQCFDPVEVVFIGIQAGIGQADNVNPTYHQGLIGYSRRYGTSYVDTVIASFGTGAIFPTLLRQNPRYYQMGTGNVFHRLEYSAMRVVITRSDSTGRNQFNFSEFLGNGMAAAISNSYHPGPRTVASTTNVFETQVLVDVAANELKEFWPDIHRLLRRVHHKA
jgi:hypothetical protein